MLDDDAHVQAFLNRLRAGVPANLAVHDGQAPNVADTPYLLVQVETGLVSRNHPYTGVSDHLNMVLRLMAVGTSARQARWAAARGRAAVIDAVLDVEGRTCWPITQVFGPLQTDEARDPDLFGQVAGYRLRSDPAL